MRARRERAPAPRLSGFVLRLSGFVVPCSAAAAPSIAQESLPQPPAEYGGRGAWVSGEIIAVDNSGGTITLARPRALRPSSTGRTDRRNQDPRVIVLELRNAKGWVYVDHDGGQERFILKEGRERLQVGQYIEVGRSKQFRGGYDKSQQQVRSRGGSRTAATAWKFRGYVLVRISPGSGGP